MTFRFAILSAVSTKQQATADKTSLEEQITQCRRVTERGWHETAGPYIVTGQSRNKYLNLRDAEMEIPAIHDLLEGGRRREYDVLVIYDHDRLRALLSMVYDSLCDYGVQLFSISLQNWPVPPDQYDPYENDTNDMMINYSNFKSKSENSRMRRKYRTGMRDRILKHHLPVQIPYGYRRPITEHYNRRAIPEPIPSIALHLIEIKDIYMRGKALSECITYLQQNQLPPPRGNVWHHQTVRDILKNPFYAGFVQFEKSKVKKDKRNNRKTRDRNIPEEKIITSTGLHKPLWDEPTWRAILEEMKRRAPHFRGRQNNQFTAILKCGECGSQLWRFKNGPRAVPDRLIWRCASAPSTHPKITHIDIAERVGKLLATSLQPSLQARQTETILTAKKDKYQAQLTELKTQRTRLEDAYLRGTFSIESYEKRAADLNARIKDLEENQSTEEVQAAKREILLAEIMRTLGAQAHKIPAWLTRTDPSEVNRILHLLLEGIILHPNGNIELVYR